MRPVKKISDLMVLQSAAGYYIGRVYRHSEDEFEPYSRESNYFATEDAARQALVDNTYIQIL